MQTTREVLQNCTVKGQVIYLPPVNLDRKLYQDTAKALQLIGGKWKGGKIAGFVFDENPAEMLTKLQTGVKLNLKKEFQFFATPAKLADWLVEIAEVEQYDMILEPSAGQGAIIKAIQAAHSATVHYCELMPLNRAFLNKIPNTVYLTDNFLKIPTSKNLRGMFHKIIANPPFSNNQDIDHIRAMYEVCAEGGRIVAVASNHWRYTSGKKETAFKQWINKLSAQVIDLPPGTFKESGTEIAACIIVIDK